MRSPSFLRPRPAVPGERRPPFHLLLLLLLALVSVPQRPARGQTQATPPAIEISIRAELVSRLLDAVVPYDVELDAGIFKEVVTLSDPRRVRLVPGGLDLEMTATGAPVPFIAEVSPRVRIVERPGGGWVIGVQSLPVSLGRLGTYDLSRFIEPVDVETVTPYLIETPGGPVPLDIVVESIRIDDEEIRIGLGARFPDGGEDSP